MKEQQLQQENKSIVQKEKSIELGFIEKEKQKTQNLKQKKSNLKVIYDEKNFKDFLNNSSHQKVPNEYQWYFASNILAIDKIYFKNFTKKVLWEDENFYYLSNYSDKIRNSYEHFNPKYSLVSYDKKNSLIGVVNGYFIILLNEDIADQKRFERQYKIKIISFYPIGKVLIARAVKNSNILNIYKNLKTHKKIKNLSIEIITHFPKEE